MTAANPNRPPKVLIVDDEILNLRVTQRRLTRHGFEVATATSGELALELLQGTEPPDLILLDITMVGMSGLQCLRAIRANPITNRLPVILTSALRESDDIVEGLQLGANDYITKPIDMPVLLARLRTHLRMAEAVHRLETQAHMLRQLAAIDVLTGAYNRRSMNAALEREVETARRKRRSLSVLMFDIDHFKQVNDTHGHGVGDVVIRGLACRAGSLLRGSDLLCRYGGEEFSVLLPETDEASASQVAERLLHGTAAEPFTTDAGPVRVTISIGMTTLRGGPGQIIEDRLLLKQADLALFYSKRNGRNRLSVFIDGAPQPVAIGCGAPS